MPSLTMGDIVTYGFSMWFGWVLAWVIITYFAPQRGKVKEAIGEGTLIFFGAVFALAHFNYHG